MSRSGDRSRGKSRTFAGNHQRSWLWGRHAVEETLAGGRWPVLSLTIDEQRRSDFSDLMQSAEQSGLRFDFASPERLTQLCGSSDHQGVIIRLGEFPCFDLTDLRQSASDALVAPRTSASAVTTAGFQPMYVLCDRIQDAHNFGAILRCCDAMAANGVIIGSSQQATPTPHVARSSAGAVNHIDLFRVDCLVEAVEQMAQLGFAIVGATEKTQQSLWECNLRQPVVLVVGTESTGIGTELLQRCSTQVAIPMMGRVNSLNAAVAVGILLAEIRRQQH
ncbi:MAG: 23S rRNA (guanosine(2251)-2'-O)-methyltransferase RlmB [Planctomycetaceae bacterium]|nr:23S rRNA (guanosine(2251)-2'-O)-methyltransferase RlmB [Planctomycetaceae bacterium]